MKNITPIYKLRLFPLLPLQKSQILGLSGTLFLIWGIFIKMFTLPFLGDIAYWNHGSTNAKLMLITGIMALMLSLLKQLKWLWIPAIIALLLLGHTFFTTYLEIMKYKELMEMMGNTRSISSIPLKPSIDVGLGLLFLLLAIIFLFLGCFLRKYLARNILIKR